MTRLINASLFSGYMICPSLYFYRYIKKYYQILNFKNQESERGDLIHKLIDAHFQEIPVKNQFLDSDVKIKSWWNYYLENFLPKNQEKVYSEWSFNVPIQTPLEKIVLTGRIDRVIYDNDKITLINWKSNQRKTRFDLYNFNLQMEFYAYAFSKIEEIESLELKLVFLDLKEASSRILKKADLEKIEDKIFQMIENTHPLIKTYIPDPVMLDTDIPACKACDFFSFCEKLL